MISLKKNWTTIFIKNPEVAKSIQNKIIQAERERKELSGIRKLARERKKASLPIKNLETVGFT